MALSSSESALLTQTCENMNIAANTCREVLEMLRNLGNTGVVDIATHNNATTAHADATNLAKLNNGNLVVGTKGQYSVHSVNYPCEIKPNGTKTYILESHNGTSVVKFQDSYYYPIVDNSGDQLTAEGAVAGGFSSGEIYRMTLYTEFSGASSNGTIVFGYGANGNVKATHWTFGCSDAAGTWYHRFSVRYNAIVPATSGALSVGLSDRPFDTAYFVTAATVTSDRREKTGISAIDSKAIDFIKALRPVQFAVKQSRIDVVSSDEDGSNPVFETTPGTRHHWGLIAQEVQEALASAGYDPSDCAVWSLADKNDPDSKQALRYEELIAPMIKVIQQQQERIEALERKVA